MIDVLVDMARSLDVLHQVDTIAFEGAVNALQEVERLALIVHGIERRDEVERLGFGHPVEFAEVDRGELNVLQALGRRLLMRGPYCFLRKVHSDEAALRKQFGQPVQNATAATPGIKPSQAAGQLVGQTWDEREDVGLK